MLDSGAQIMTLDSQILKIKFVDHIAKKMHGKRLQMITFIPGCLFYLFIFKAAVYPIALEAYQSAAEASLYILMDKSQKLAVFRLFAKAIASQNGQNCPRKNEGNTQNI